MKEVIAPIPREAIEAELTKDKILRATNKGGNMIYIITHHNSPNTMQEIGRLRELTFRHAGGGTGKSTDIDDYDTAEIPFQQLIVWDPDRREILGGYRYILCSNVPKDKDGNVLSPTSRLFAFSKEFNEKFLPRTIELGRSFVQPDYQSSKAGAKALFALDNLWDGLGALTINHPEMEYFFGKVTMYQHYNSEARDLILHFFDTYFHDKDNLVVPRPEHTLKSEKESYQGIFDTDDYNECYKELSKRVRELGENIPPLVNAYMNLSPSMRTFGTVINDHFGNVEETGIIITIKDIYQGKIDRHVSSYLEELAEKGIHTKFRFQ